MEIIKQKDLKVIRKQHDMTQFEFSVLINCSVRMYQFYEAMEYIMPLHFLELLSYKLEHLANKSVEHERNSKDEVGSSEGDKEHS